jgi:hypothetical protein
VVWICDELQQIEAERERRKCFHATRIKININKNNNRAHQEGIKGIVVVKQVSTGTEARATRRKGIKPDKGKRLLGGEAPRTEPETDCEEIRK